MMEAMLNSQKAPPPPPSTLFFFPRCCGLVISRIEWQRRQTVMRSPCCAHSGASYPPLKTTLPPSLHPFPWEMSPAVVGVQDNGGETPGETEEVAADRFACSCLPFPQPQRPIKRGVNREWQPFLTPGASVWARPRPLCLPRSYEPGICHLPSTMWHAGSGDTVKEGCLGRACSSV